MTKKTKFKFIVEYSLNNPWSIKMVNAKGAMDSIGAISWGKILFQFKTIPTLTQQHSKLIDWTALDPTERQQIIIIHSFLWRNFIPFENSAPNEDGEIQDWIPAEIYPNLLAYAFNLENSFPHFSDDQNAWCFYGGTFNPWHPGHGQCVEMCEAPAIFILPDNNPLKMMNRPLAESLNDIWSQTGLVKKSLPYLGFVASYKPNPTYPWLNQVKQKHPQKKLSLLMGMDSFISLKQWFSTEKLMLIVDQIHVVPRSLEDMSAFNKTKWEDIYQETLHWVVQVKPTLIIKLLPNHPFESVSSTRLRQKILYHKQKKNEKLP